MDTLYMRMGATNPLVQIIRVASLENKNNPIKAELSWQWCRWAKATKDSLYWSRPLLAEAELSHRNKAIMSPWPSESTTFDPADLSNREQISEHPDRLWLQLCHGVWKHPSVPIRTARINVRFLKPGWTGALQMQKPASYKESDKKRWIQLLLRRIYSVLMPKGKPFVQQ